MSSAVSEATSQDLPSDIYFEDKTPIEPKAGRFWSIVLYPLEVVGIALRNALYLPLYSEKTRAENKHELDLAREFAAKVKETTAPLHSTRKIDAIREHFTVRDVRVNVCQGQTTRTFTVRLFESKAEMVGKKIQLILFSFYDNKENGRRWEPLTMKDLSKAPLDVLRALKNEGVQVDALITQSLGNVAYDGLQYLPKEDADVIPKTLISNRGLVSIWKVARQLFSFPFSWLLYGAAKISGWNADPEKGLLEFLSKNPQCSDGTLREVVVVEAIKDHFYSGPGSFDPNFHHDIKDLGLPVFRGKFYPGTVHQRAHHAIPWSKLKNNSATELVAGENLLKLEREESVTAALAKKIFSEKGDHYTCFYVGGNGSTLDVGTWDVAHFLGSLIKESQKTPG